jgi:uncharacterized protein YeaO (DUF488 family)
LSEAQVLRVYDDPGRTPGEHRVLVDRLWPRGVKKETLDYDEWPKEVTPSSELRRWYGHEPSRFEEFARRYSEELNRAPAVTTLDRLREIAGRERVVLLTATRDVEHSGAEVLAAVLSEGRS